MENEIKKLCKEMKKGELIELGEKVGLGKPKDAKKVKKEDVAYLIVEKVEEFNTMIEASRNVKKDMKGMRTSKSRPKVKEGFAKNRDFSSTNRPAPSSNKVNHSVANNKGGVRNPRLKPDPVKGTYKGKCVKTGEKLYTKSK